MVGGPAGIFCDLGECGGGDHIVDHGDQIRGGDGASVSGAIDSLEGEGILAHHKRGGSRIVDPFALAIGCGKAERFAGQQQFDAGTRFRVAGENLGRF